jgi:group II intron reverse transcriptase/maturase
VSLGAERVRQFAERKPGEKLTALLHHITPEALREAYLALKRDAAPGVDRVTWREYGDGLDERLLDLHGRVHRGAYRAKPVRRVEVPKPDGGIRPLGIVSLEDKIVQRAVVDNLLNPVFEPGFYGFSYGFRPGRSAHDALDALAYAVERRKVSWIVEVDIRGFFDSIDRERLMSFLGMRIGDERVLHLIRKWLSAGVTDAGLDVDFVRGTPQGAPISPLLANVYLHNVLDDWFAREWRPREARGEAYIVRYADDFVLGFQHRDDAARFMEALRARLEAHGLELHPEKTRLVEFGRFADASRRKRGEGRPETFDFLGFTHYCRTRRDGRPGLGRKPSAGRMRRTLKAIKAGLRRRMHDNPVKTGEWLGRVLRGWLGYYAVPTSFRTLSRFVRVVRDLWLRSLRRRAQQRRFSWPRLLALSNRLWPRLSILHPWPAERFAVTTQGKSRMR